MKREALMEAALSQEARFSTEDPDAFAEGISTAVPNKPLSVRPIGARFEANAHLVVLPRVSLFTFQIDDARISQSGGVSECGINIPLAEPVQFHDGITRRVVPSGTAFVRRPGDSFDLITPHRSFVLVAHLFPPLLMWLEEKSQQSLQFGDTLSLESPAGESFSHYLRFIWGELQRGSACVYPPLVTHEIENTLAALFHAAAQSGRQEQHTLLTAKRPSYLARAEEYIRAHLTEPLSILDIAAAARISPRTLSKAFRKYRDVSTSAFVKQLRLEAAQRDLLAAVPGNTTITDVAMRYGFFHLGRFSTHYRRTFGEMPSETLRRSFSL